MTKAESDCCYEETNQVETDESEHRKLPSELHGYSLKRRDSDSLGSESNTLHCRESVSSNTEDLSAKLWRFLL